MSGWWERDINKGSREEQTQEDLKLLFDCVELKPLGGCPRSAVRKTDCKLIWTTQDRLGGKRSLCESSARNYICKILNKVTQRGNAEEEKRRAG